MLAALSFALALKSVPVDVRAALLWLLLIFTAVTGLGRVYVREEELGTADALRLAAPATAVHAGKLAFNLLLLGVVQAAAEALFFVVLPLPAGAAMNAGLLLGVNALGGVGLAVILTFVAALVAPASGAGGAGRGALYFVVAFPMLLPVLRAATQGTLAALAPAASPAGTGYDSLVLLTGYDVAIAAASFGLIGAVWSE